MPRNGDVTPRFPDIDRVDVEVAVVCQRETSGPFAQHALAEATVAAWDAASWPDHLLSRTCYVSTDGQRVLTYEQWRVEPPAMGPHDIAFRLYRSGTRDKPPPVGCIVIVEVGTDGHDTARAWVDAVFAALESEPVLRAGGIAGHFHVSLDGTRVMNYAEWVDEASHVDAIGQAGSIGRGPAWQRVHVHPGVSNLGVRRYVPTDAREKRDGLSRRIAQ